MKNTAFVLMAFAEAVAAGQLPPSRPVPALTPEQTLDRRAVGDRTAGDLEFSPDGSRLLFSVGEPVKAAVRARAIWRLDVTSGQLRQLTFSGKNDTAPRWSPDGDSVTFVSDRDGTPQLYRLSMRGGEAEKLTDRKEAVGAYRWSPDGTRIALLMAEPKPEALQQREREKDDGRVVDKDNRRQRVWDGERFVEMNRADWGGGDFKDVMAGVDWLIARGIADPNRLGIGGWSYGGYMAAWAVTQTTRFKAAVSGAPVIDMASEFGTENGSAYDEWFYGTPYEKLDGFIKSSPITFVRNVKTPTLLLQGEDDTTDPIGQSQQFYRGLKRYGVDSDFVLYPREPHGLREEKHLLDRLNRIIAWYDKYLKPAPASTAPQP